MTTRSAPSHGTSTASLFYVPSEVPKGCGDSIEYSCWTMTSSAASAELLAAPLPPLVLANDSAADAAARRIDSTALLPSQPCIVAMVLNSAV